MAARTAAGVTTWEVQTSVGVYRAAAPTEIEAKHIVNLTLRDRNHVGATIGNASKAGTRPEPHGTVTFVRALPTRAPL